MILDESRDIGMRKDSNKHSMERESNLPLTQGRREYMET
jgi:hypothetical protein